MMMTAVAFLAKSKAASLKRKVRFSFFAVINDLIACVPKMYLSPQIWIWHWDTKCDWIRDSLVALAMFELLFLTAWNILFELSFC